MDFQALTDIETLTRLLPERIEEYNRMHRDEREHLSLLPSDPDALRIRVSGVREDAATDFVASLTQNADGFTKIAGKLEKTARGSKRFWAVLYRLLLAGAARLTLLALLYGAVLGISLLVGGDSLWLPLLPSVACALWMSFSALRVALSKRRRTVSFFTAYLGCKQLPEKDTRTYR